MTDSNLLDVRRFSTDLQSIELPDGARFLGSRRNSSLRPDSDGSRRNSNLHGDKETGGPVMELKTLPEDPGNSDDSFQLSFSVENHQQTGYLTY